MPFATCNHPMINGVALTVRATRIAAASRRQARGHARTRYAAVRSAHPLPGRARRAGNPLSPDRLVLADRRPAGETPAPLKASSFANRLTGLQAGEGRLAGPRL